VLKKRINSQKKQKTLSCKEGIRPNREVAGANYGRKAAEALVVQKRRKDDSTQQQKSPSKEENEVV